MAEYRKITDEILKRMPDEDQYPRPAASVDPPIGRVCAVRWFLRIVAVKALLGIGETS
ncbi:hypothetical protein HFN78_30820 [Rhizobium laguerreae]|uniref:hypothetical protein n=1 Tax=Rhizobium laguerreae TaxID=1076926 RepID=UPI001C91EB97|nr:hypothetical protein [Rhizobium laguerreae]MBY3143288.1 hypothetical protein [Rhizobium laguerreae]MBY3475261.1 hypothetical protein [Rhizobium laguerreae]